MPCAHECHQQHIIEIICIYVTLLELYAMYRGNKLKFYLTTETCMCIYVYIYIYSIDNRCIRYTNQIDIDRY